MKKFKYLLFFVLLFGAIALSYVLWFFKWAILTAAVLYVVYQLDKGYKAAKTKIKSKLGGK